MRLFFTLLKLRVFVDDMKAFMNGNNKELAEMAEKVPNTMLTKLITDRKFYFGELISGYRRQIPEFRESISDAITERFCALPEP